jgi:hypothetical protein
MKMNWGKGIIVSFAIFMVAILSMVIYILNQKFDLVAENYYEKTLTYQNQIDAEERTLAESNIVSFENNILIINYSDSLITKGEINFYRPSDSSKDFKKSFQTDENGKFNFPLNTLLKGYWKIQVSWNKNEKSFYTELPIVIN